MLPPYWTVFPCTLPKRQRLEFDCLVADCGFRWQALHGARTIEAMDPLAALENVSSVARHRNGSAVTQNDDAVTHGPRCSRDGVDLRHTLIQRLGGGRADGAAGGDAHM